MHKQQNIITIIHLRATFTARNRVNLGPHTGTTMRAALLNTLRGPDDDLSAGFCTHRQRRECNGCPALQHCPVAAVVGLNQPDTARPYALRVSNPGKMRYKPGESWTLGVSLFAPHLYDYFLQAMRHIPADLSRIDNCQIDLTALTTVNLVTGEEAPPESPVYTTPGDISRRAKVIQRAMNKQHGGIQVRFESATGLKFSKGRVAQTPHLDIVLHRVQTRLALLQGQLPGTKSVAQDDVALIHNQSRWVDAVSPSRRTHSVSDVGGLVGTAAYTVDRKAQRDAATLLAWGEAVQIGWGTTKGGGVIFANTAGF